MSYVNKHSRDWYTSSLPLICWTPKVMFIMNTKERFGFVNLLSTLCECCTSYEKWVLNYEENG
jgi:hypothetical protein